MGWTVETLQLDDPLIFNEQVGDPVADFGGTPTPAPRMALRHSVSLPTFTANAGSDTVAQRLTLRRQLRSLLNNSPWKIQGLYVVWAADPEQSGWYVPDMGQLADGAGDGTGLSTGYWVLANVVWRASGKRRTHRRSAQVTMLPLQSILTPRDYLQRIYSTDFSGLTPLALTYLPPAATDIVNSSNYLALAASTMSAGSDGGAVKVVQSLANLTTASYEQPETSQTLTGVLAYDRLGANTSTTEANWSQVYGPDWPWYWPNTSSSNPDTPVLENGYCRVRYDNTAGTEPGWRVDAWNGSSWVEQGKINIVRVNGASVNYDNVLQSAGLEEYTPERAVMKCVQSTTADASSREVIFITLQRGWTGPRIEVYPAQASAGNNAGAYISWTAASADSDDAVMAIASGGGTNVSTALGTGHSGLLGTGTIVGTLSDNAFAMLRSAAAGSGGLAIQFQVSMAVVQASIVPSYDDANIGYGGSPGHNQMLARSTSTAGYCSAQFALTPVDAHQVMEAENMTLGSGTSSSSDATASQALAASTTRTSDSGAHVTQATWPDSDTGIFRVFARCRVTAGTGHFYAKADGAGGTTGGTVTTTSTSYVWLDLGDITVATAGTLEIHAWGSSGTTFVDRIEAYVRQDRVDATPSFAGAQDVGQAALYESFVLNGIVSRA